MNVNYGSDLYTVRADRNPYPRDTIVRLANVYAEVKGGKLNVQFWHDSTIKKLDIDWKVVKAWHTNIDRARTPSRASSVETVF